MCELLKFTLVAGVIGLVLWFVFLELADAFCQAMENATNWTKDKWE